MEELDNELDETLLDDKEVLERLLMEEELTELDEVLEDALERLCAIEVNGTAQASKADKGRRVRFIVIV
jgi:hypothetical protein